MSQLLHLWNPTSLFPPSFPSPFLPLPATWKHPQLALAPKTSLDSTTTAKVDEEQMQPSGRERRRLRHERRESKAGCNWRKEVEEKLIKKTKKKSVPKSVEVNLDNLAHLGPQWWVFRVSRVRGHETAQLVAKLLARNFPNLEFKVYAPTVHVKRKLKNGTYSIKPRPIFPGCVFLRCIMNREVHDFVRECEGVGGFVGAKVGCARRQITKPRPVDEDDMEEIFQQAKEEQEKHDQAFEQEQQGEETLNLKKLDMNDNVTENVTGSNRGKGSSKASDPLGNGSLGRRERNLLTPGSTVQVVSGTFAEFKGTLKKIHRKSGKATVGFTLFGKESLVDLDLNEIVAET